MLKTIFLSAITLITFTSCAQQSKSKSTTKAMETTKITSANLDTITLGTGCFWCTEAVFQQLEGVQKVTSGYSGGSVINPTYEQVCDKTTGHAECLNIVYDPSVITLDELLEVFWKVHDPTTLNRQGADVGPQYRSVIFYTNQLQKTTAEKYIAELDKSGAYENPIVTTLEPMTVFYAAEDYHQNYYNNNSNKNSYCQIVIRPKLEKFEKVFKSKLKKQ
jgi:peptide-methionine (S)-S-oxide reductase